MAKHKHAEVETVARRGCGRHRFETVGLYIPPPGLFPKKQIQSLDQARLFEFCKACGYNRLEFCEIGFSSRPDLLPGYYEKMSAAMDAARKMEFQVWMLILAGMKQWKGPAESGRAGTFCALEKSLLKERFSHIRQALRGLCKADGFVFFAGDPGGDTEGRTTLQDCLDMAREVRRLARENAPGTRFAVNLWAIAEWAGFPSPFSLEFWQKQALLSQAAAEEKDFLGPDCGVFFSMDNYYRSLTLACYADAELKPALYPALEDVRHLRSRGVRPICGWPYFLVDEVDDGFITPNNIASGGQSQAETRYIRAVIDQGLRLELDGLTANASFIPVEQLNIYAFGRMAREPGLSPEALLEEYAGFIANDKTRGALAQVLRFIENNSNWQNSLPPENRLPDFDCGDLTSAASALNLLDRVAPRRRPLIPLPEAPERYIQRLRKRLEAIASGDIGGVAPIARRRD